MPQANRKGQEEMVGFALIVVLVVVAGVIALGVSLRQDNSAANIASVDISHFLESALQTTTECVLREENKHATLSELMGTCYSNPMKECSSGQPVCIALNESAREIIEKSWNVGQNYSAKGYVFSVDYTSRTGVREEKVLEISQGECSGDYIFNEYLIREGSTRGTLINSLKVCS